MYGLPEHFCDITKHSGDAAENCLCSDCRKTSQTRLDGVGQCERCGLSARMMDVPGSGRGRAPHRSPHTARRVLIPRTTESRGASAPAAASTELSSSCTRSSGRRSSVDFACCPTLGPLVPTAPHTTPTTCAG